MRSTRLIFMFAILLLLAACGKADDEPLPTTQSIAELTPTIAQTAVPLPTNTPQPKLIDIDWPPAIIDNSPQPGEELAVDGTITLRFDQPMDQASVAAALLVEDVDGAAINGTIAWPQADTLTFTPDAELARKTSYRLRLGEQASGANGLPLVEPIEAYFQTIGALAVTQVIPDDRTQKVETDTAITAMYNRPVVPLVSTGQQANLPQPLTFDPPVNGTGEWVSTSIYRFTPAEPLAGATSYQVTMADLVDLSGAVLDGGYSWSFSTVAPDVVTVFPTHESEQVAPTTPITVTFNMPMDRNATETAVALGSVGYTADLSFAWSDDDRVVAITPAEMLPLGETYQLIIGTGAASANGNAQLARENITAFTVVPYPAVLSTYPANGQTADPWQYGVSVDFASPMDPKTLEDRLTITPAPDKVNYNVYEQGMGLYFSMERSTEYTITIPGDAADPYGNTLGRDYTWTFSAPEAEPLATFNLVNGINQLTRDFPTAVDVIYRNVSVADIALYDLGLNLNLINNPYELQEYRPASEPVRTWSLPINLPENQLAVEPLQLADGGVLAPGFYMLTITTPETAADDVRYWQNQRVALVVSDDNVVVKEMSDDIYVWVTRLTDGQADANREVRLFNEQGAMVQTAVSDQNGFARFNNPHDFDYFNGYTIVSGDAGQTGFGIGRSDWSGGVSLWEMGIESRSYMERPSFSYLYSDRPIYRPGDTVYYKGIVRDPNYGRYAPPTVREVTLRLAPNSYYQDNSLDETIKVELDEYGHFAGEFPLSDGITLGSYLLSVEGNSSSAYSFTVADYRKPEFLIVMEADDAELLRGTQTAVSLQADYFAGGSVSDAPVNWSISARPFSPQFEGQFYYFGDGGGFNYQSSGFFTSMDDTDYFDGGNGVTDANGHLAIPLPANLMDEVSAGSKTVTVEAQVGGLGEFPVASNTTVIMHAADGYVGVVAQETIADVGKETAVDLITVDWDGEPLPNQAIAVVFYQREWVSERKNQYGMYYTDWTTVDTEVGRADVTTGSDGRAIAPITPAEGGSYIAVATFTDGAGRTHTSSAPFWVYSADYGGWRTDQRERALELVADRDGYKTGDVAHLLVQSPFPAPVQAWLTIERGDLIEQRLITLGSSSDTLDIPILADYAPNVYVSLVIVKGVTPDSDYPWADIRFGVVNLPVSTEQLQLTIAMRPQVTQVEPGETAVYDISVTDYSGNPVQAELSLALVDLAVLTLKPDTTDIVEAFYYQQAYRSQTGSGLFISGEGLEVEVPLQGGGFGGGGGADKAEAALSSTPEDEEDSTRTDFRDTAYWEAKIETDASGQAHVEIDLPDNATTWRLSSKAVSLPPADGLLVGQSTVDIVATLPLLVRAVTPRFFTVGDEMQILATVQNNTDGVLETAVSLTAAGLTIQDAAEQTVTIAAHGRQLVQWSVLVDDVQFVDITITAESGGYRDATKPSFGIAPDQLLPVYRYNGRDLVGTSGVLSDDVRRVEAILLPEGVDRQRGTVNTVLNGSLGAAIFESMEAREPYTWETACAGSVADRLLPNAAVARAIAELGLDETAMQAQLDDLILADVAALEALNAANGGWGWCYSNESDPWLTAYALLALVQADQAGYATDAARLNSAALYLERELKPADKLVNSYAANRQAFFIYVLAAQGRSIIADADALVEEHQALLDPYAKGYLLMAYELNSANSPNQQSLLSDLNGAAIVSATGAHWEDAAQDYGNLSSDIRGTAVIIQALSMTAPQNQMIPSAVRWLMSARTALQWRTTHETAWSLTALTDWAIVSADFEADYEYALLVNGVEEENGAFTAENLTDSVTNSVAIGDLSLTEPNYFDYQKQGDGNLYYTTHMDSYIAVEYLAPLSRGISVQRTYYDAACDPKVETCEPITRITAGGKVRVVLDIIAANDLVYATIEDPLPAGAEAIDPNLGTSPGNLGGGMESDRSACWGCWGYWYFNRIEYRDEMVVFMSNFLPAGSYRYSYTLQTNIPGAYQVMPTFASEAYFPEVNGRSDGLLFVIE